MKIHLHIQKMLLKNPIKREYIRILKLIERRKHFKPSY